MPPGIFLRKQQGKCYRKKNKSKDYARIKEILRKYVKPKDGDMFRISRASPNDWHWVRATQYWYIDEGNHDHA